MIGFLENNLLALYVQTLMEWIDLEQNGVVEG